ncbi:hypothetical protein Fmac_015754 [Flemingia macrophylla]|uniref:Uncharacterized protein n=1 Tax=Flemingia macrophylla TaxID=520843 RepID=A0ABD1MFG1_9FABA
MRNKRSKLSIDLSSKIGSSSIKEDDIGNPPPPLQLPRRCPLLHRPPLSQRFPSQPPSSPSPPPPPPPPTTRIPTTSPQPNKLKLPTQASSFTHVSLTTTTTLTLSKTSFKSTLSGNLLHAPSPLAPTAPTTSPTLQPSVAPPFCGSETASTCSTTMLIRTNMRMIISVLIITNVCISGTAHGTRKLGQKNVKQIY